ncbi:MAG: (2Fe-2S) ferredoxin domain-containing protein [Pseudomonadales bacterium]
MAAYLEKEILARNLDVEIERTVCLGHCPKGPNVRLLGGPFIHEANEDKLDTLMNEITDQTNMKNKTI